MPQGMAIGVVTAASLGGGRVVVPWPGAIGPFRYTLDLLTERGLSAPAGAAQRCFTSRLKQGQVRNLDDGFESDAVVQIEWFSDISN